MDKSTKLRAASEKKVKFKVKRSSVSEKDLQLLEENKLKFVQRIKDHNTCLWWVCLAILRVCLAFIQTGYIHPDEFHQSLQVRANDVLSIEGQKPWEYTSSSPLRSVVFSSFISLPYNALLWLDPIVNIVFGTSIVSPRILLITPRLFVTLLSFICDFCVYRIARFCYLKPWMCMEVFASSYVMLVYCTRTFSNTLELILMCLLLWRVSSSVVESTKIFRKESLINDLYQTTENLRERVKLARIKSGLPPYNYADSFFISVILTLGAFIRPTFLIYSFVPVTYWLQRGVITHNLDFKYFNRRWFSLLPGISATSFLCVIADSFYYQSITIKELAFGNITALSFTVTPINFLLYNKDPKNLAKHGSHPHYVHFAVNMPLLHGVLALVGMYHASLFLSSFFSSSKITRKPKVYSLATMMMFTYFVPVMILSAFPHQEPRFLLPTLPCLVLLFSESVSIPNIFKFRFTKHFLFIMWNFWNIMCVVFYGFVHQGGVTSSIIQLQHQIEQSNLRVPVHIYFAHMYTPPTFLLMQRIEITTKTPHGTKFKVPRKIKSHHMSNVKNNSQISATLQDRLRALDLAEVFLLVPASVGVPLVHQNSEKLEFTLVNRIPYHLSMENLPQYPSYLEEEECDETCVAKSFIEQIGLNVYRVELVSSILTERQPDFKS